jgi:23S rRNA (cytidine1920-2'-O)/16S rRNA (cytidine1409-2'-O)-methyltransferase
LHAKIKADRRVVSLEGVNARDLTRAKVPESPQVVVADVSFISLKQALPSALGLASRDAWAVFLVKPQFELGRWGTPRSGVVKDDSARKAVLIELTEWVKGQGWTILGSMESPIAGGDGNKEYLLAAARGESAKKPPA